jgi:hypothetical protein
MYFLFFEFSVLMPPPHLLPMWHLCCQNIARLINLPQDGGYYE